ncbi:unnamed protein product [Medioppia subpectinata]|uniref:Cytochrome P450 n=1 Tax=Medioppia subpectinata TaxID=1979941 RepID=A0A7R9KXX0_9ACAR|nr:unnamed protein product [Medioppia subpectinata]CAG2111556.1 unnamed protein product [Medioppia subpectinata]
MYVGNNIYYRKWRRILSYWERVNIPGPTPVPLYGNVLALSLNPRPYLELKWYKKYGRIYGVYIYGKPSLRVAEPALIKQILVKNFTSFKNREAPSWNATLMSKMLIRAPYEDWRRIRVIAGPAFTGGKLKHLYPLVDQCCRDLVNRLDSRVAANGSPVALRPLISEYIMSALGQCAFSTKVNTDPTHLFTTEPEGYVSVPLWNVFVTNVLPACLVDNPVANSLAKWWHSDYLYHRVFTTRLMADRRCDDADKRHDFLQFLMKGSHRSASAAHPDVTGITDEEIFAQCFLFFIAGYDPTANTVSHALHELALNPDIQDRLREETAINGYRDRNYERLSQLPLLDAVVSETLRKYPPLVRVEREAVEDVVLTDDTQGLSVKVEKGVVIEVPVYAIHHDLDHYPDPFAFKPDRFLPQNRHHIKPYTYLPFGDGPRNCIGMRFGLLMTKLALDYTAMLYVNHNSGNSSEKRTSGQPTCNCPFSMEKLHCIQVQWSSKTKATPLSPANIAAAFILALIAVGYIDESMTRRLRTPLTRSLSSSTTSLLPAPPIRQLPVV